MILTVCTWNGPFADCDEINGPCLETVRAAIARLDGETCTEVTLTHNEPFAYIAAAGGPELYLVTGETIDEEIFQVTDPDAPEGSVVMVCGGQRAEFARRDLVNRDTALRAFTQFLRDHDPAPPSHAGSAH
ncbi:hypothetical protein KDK95_15790 [Actinospica sp. MGRD01-02]|uniref:Uncharacterized protein n=1 Tax=Actinospica acidithermotolerans TaxID=2828514 RepID=A0A941EA45_9ACTN|nr:Imm1 family immunity protein [Actinospica acidithermotolerans]MBR7827781.1 hypothetical protein [Actinospica acidithermotolerans]